MFSVTYIASNNMLGEKKNQHVQFWFIYWSEIYSIYEKVFLKEEMETFQSDEFEYLAR